MCMGFTSGTSLSISSVVVPTAIAPAAMSKTSRPSCNHKLFQKRMLVIIIDPADMLTYKFPNPNIF